jgi:polyhydroxybutyrate depolymerase
VARGVSIVVLCLLVACSAAGDSDGRASTATPAAARSTSQAPLDDFVVGGDRPVTVGVPASYDGAAPAPVLIVLHGYGSAGSEARAYLMLDDFAEVNGMLTAYPEGTP